MKDRVLKRWIIPILAGACLSVGMSGQSTESQKKTKSDLQKPEITKFFIADPEEDSGYETGALHIIYSDGTEIVETLPPPKASTEKEAAFNAVGFADVQLAEDRQALGWTINVENCCTSYSIPLSVVVFRDKHVLHTFSDGMMVWSWKFLQGGKQVQAVFGPTHGDFSEDLLYDVSTGKLISGAQDEQKTQTPKAEAPRLASTSGDDLIHAAKEGDLPRVLALLGSHVDVNSRLTGNLDGGTTALIEASKAGQFDIVKALIAANADVNAKDEVLEETALMYASANGQLDIVRALLAAHASVNARGIYGNPSALFLASAGGHAAAVSALIAGRTQM